MSSVREGQIWIDCDRRMADRRRLRIVAVGATDAVVENLATKRRTVISLKRFREGSTGYQLAATEGGTVSDPLTDAERIAQLEAAVASLTARMAFYDGFFVPKVNPYDGTTGLMTNGRFGVMTEFWMMQPAGEGFAFSAATITDQGAIYGEVDAISRKTGPTTAIYAAVVAPNPFGQKNIALQVHANGSSVANVSIHATGDGIELGASVSQWFIGKIGQLKKLWP